VVPICAVASLAVLCGACELSGPRQKREIAPAVLFVQKPSAGGDAQAQADGSVARPFPSLRAALAAAPEGALLRLEEGVYRESLQITRPVVLLGKGVGRTRIVAPAGSASTVEVRADRVEMYGVSIEGGGTCAVFYGGAHRLRRVELRGCAKAGLSARRARVEILSSTIVDVSGGEEGRGIDLDGGLLDARGVALRFAGRRAVVLHGARGLLEDVTVQESTLSALQATDGADVRVVRGDYEGRAGAALYAGGAHLAVDGARVRHGEYAVLGYRGAELSVRGSELTDYSVAAVAMVNSHGSVERVTIARGGTDAAISVTRADGKKPVLLADNRISRPGTMGVHVTESSVTARGNIITGATLDAEGDMGDAFYAVDSRLVIEQNVLRGNAGSGVAAVRSTVRLRGNGFIGNGRAGVLLLDASRGTATGNTFAGNHKAGVELVERSSARLDGNRFGGIGPLDVDAGCGRGEGGKTQIGSGNLAMAGRLRQRTCPE